MQGDYFYLGPNIKIEPGQQVAFTFTFDEVLSAAQEQALRAFDYAGTTLDALSPVGAALYTFVFTPWGVEMSQEIAAEVERRARAVGAELKAYTLEKLDDAADIVPGVGSTIFGAGWPLLLGLALILAITYEVKK